MIAPAHVVKEWEGEMANPLANITKLEGLKSWKNGRNAPYQGVVKRDWVPTGRIDFATKLNGNDQPDQPSEFRLLVEERRIIESIAGNENLEIQWRAATLKEAKAVVTQYHQYLKGKLAHQIYLRARYFASGISRQGFVKRGNKGAVLKSSQAIANWRHLSGLP